MRVCVSQHALGRGVSIPACTGWGVCLGECLPPADTKGYGQQAGGTHPTGMHSGLLWNFKPPKSLVHLRDFKL